MEDFKSWNEKLYKVHEWCTFHCPSSCSDTNVYDTLSQMQLGKNVLSLLLAPPRVTGKQGFCENNNSVNTSQCVCSKQMTEKNQQQNIREI